MKMLEKISGKVVKGRGLARKMGYPSLNLEYNGELRGVFSGRIFLDGEWHKAAIHLGPRPTVGDEKPVCEIYVLSWNGEVSSNANIEVEVLEKIRDIEKFSSLEELQKRIAKDVEYVKMTSC